MFQVTVDTGTGAQPQKKGTLQLDRVTGETKKWEPFEAQSKGRQWRSWMRFVHTGEYYGLVGQTIACLVTAGSVVLVYTGLALTWRRFRAWRAAQAARRAGDDGRIETTERCGPHGVPPCRSRPGSRPSHLGVSASIARR